MLKVDNDMKTSEIMEGCFEMRRIYIDTLDSLFGSSLVKELIKRRADGKEPIIVGRSEAGQGESKPPVDFCQPEYTDE